LIYTVGMSKRAKKRTKRYHGEDAKQNTRVPSEPVVHRYEAVERSRFGEWWEPRKKLFRFGAIAAAVAAGATWLIVELVQLVF
jgi:hypothetical protein